MAVLKYLESPRKDLGSIVIDSGLVINCNDSIEIFFDMTDEIRMQTEKIVILQLTQERFSLQQSNSASNAKLYYVKENESFYIYGNDGWTVVITTNEIGHIIGNPKNIVPTSITRGDTTYAPLTLATQVFTDDGETVESKLDQIGQLSSSFDSILVTEKSTSFDIPVPYDEFFSYPNAMTVYVGTVQVYPSRYSVEGNRITFQEPVDANRTINFNFLFNSKIPTMGVMKYIDGAYIARGTIPIDRMAKYSNDIYTNDTTSVATSAAVRKLFDTLTPLIDGADIIRRCVTTNTSVNLHSNLTEEYKLLDGNVLLCKFHTDVADNATLLVAGTAYPIYNLDGNPIKQGQINQNDELFIQYNDSNKRFYVTNGLPYGIQTRSAVEIATEGQTEFSYANVAYNRGTDYMAVFQNSVKLIEKEHFTFDGKNKRINLIGYTAEEGDVFEFVVLSIVRSRSLGDGVMVGLNSAEELLLSKVNKLESKVAESFVDRAREADRLTNSVKINGVNFNGSSNIDILSHTELYFLREEYTIRELRDFINNTLINYTNTTNELYIRVIIDLNIDTAFIRAWNTHNLDYIYSDHLTVTMIEVIKHSDSSWTIRFTHNGREFVSIKNGSVFGSMKLLASGEFDSQGRFIVCADGFGESVSSCINVNDQGHIVYADGTEEWIEV